MCACQTPQTDTLLTIIEAATAVQESPATIKRWVYEGVIAVERVGPFQRPRIRLSTLQRMYPIDLVRVPSHLVSSR